MQALDLHLEQAVNYNSPSTQCFQGLKSNTQDESTFQRALDKVRTETQSAEEAKATTDGIQQKQIEAQDQSSSVHEGEKESAFINKEDSGRFSMHQGSNLNDVSFNVNESTQLQLESKEIQEEEIVDFFSGLGEDDSIELTQEQEEFLLQDSLLTQNTTQEILMADEGLRSQIKDTEHISDSIQNGSATDALVLNDIVTEDEATDALIQSLLTAPLPVSTQVSKSDISGESPESSSKTSGDAVNLIGNSNSSLISVVDERTVTKEAINEGSFVTSVSYDNNGNAEMTLNLPDQQPSSLLPQVGNEVNVDTAHTRFGEMLSTELQSSAKEFVKAGSIVLRDNNSGTINLILHPEELGNVKIQLEITDKLIAGKIIVQSEEAFNAFKANLDSLRQAFADSGFENSGFDLSWNNNGKEGQDDSQQNKQGNVYADAIPEISEEDYALQLARDAVIYGTSVINMIA